MPMGGVLGGVEMRGWAFLRGLSFVAAVGMMIPFTAIGAARTAAATPALAASPPAAVSSAVVKVQAAPRIPKGASPLGSLPSSATVSGEVVLQPRDNAALQAFINEVSNKYSPQFHHYLAPGAFAGR